MPVDLALLTQAAPPGSKSLLNPDASHGDIGYWFHETAEPVKAWLQQHLDAQAQVDHN